MTLRTTTMKKKFLLLMGGFSIGILLHAQVGINTQNPLGVFHIDGASTAASTNPGSGIPNAVQQLDDVVILNNGNMGIGMINPSAKVVIEDGATSLSPKAVLKIVDPNVKKGRIMTAVNASGQATWKDYKYMGKIGQVYGTTSLPAQNFPAGVITTIKKDASNVWSFTVPEEGYYAFDIRWWATYPANAPMVLSNTATHFYLNLLGVTVDQYEVYVTINTVDSNRLTAYFALYYSASTADVSKTITIAVRPGIAPTAAGQSTNNNASTPWTISKITVKRMDI